MGRIVDSPVGWLGCRYVTVPPAWVFVLGALAAWRVWKLLSTDDILDYWDIRERVAPTGSARREFLSCPYCAGFWVCALGALGYLAVSDAGVSWGSAFGWAVTAFALSAVVVFIEILLDLTVAKKDLAEVHADEIDA